MVKKRTGGQKAASESIPLRYRSNQASCRSFWLMTDSAPKSESPANVTSYWPWVHGPMRSIWRVDFVLLSAM